MRRIIHLAMINSLLTMALTSTLEAAVMVYTDRATWLTHLQGARAEAFESDAPGNYPTPFQSAEGTVLTTVSGQAGTVQVLGSGMINGTRELHFREFGAGMLVTLTGDTRGVGFAYQTSESWNAEFGGMTYALPASSTGFLGFVDDSVLHKTLKFSTAAVVQGGISLDDLSVEQIPAFGLGHTPLGVARIGVVSGALVVSAIGSGGQDGVMVGAGASNGLHVVMSLPNPMSMPVGAFIKYRIHKAVPASGDHMVGEMLIERTASGFRHTPDFGGTGSPTYSLTLLRNGAPVYHRTGASGVAGVASAISASDGICSHTGSDGITHTTQETAVASWDVGGGQIVTADALVADAETTTFPGVGDLRMDYLASGISDFSLSPEFLMMFGTSTKAPQVHRALGQAMFTAAANQLTMSNIGSSGNDGVRLDFDELAPAFGLPAVHGIDVDLAPISLLPTETFNLSATGVFNGVPNSTLGQARLRNNGGQMELTADFSAIGATTVRVEVYSGGQFVGTVNVPSGGVVGRLGSGVQISGCGKVPPSPLSCFVLNTQSPTPFMPATGGPSITGDEFRLLAANATGTIDRLSFFDMSKAGGSFSIVDETAFTTGVQGVPMLSVWGLAALVLLIATVGTLYLRRDI